MTDLREEIVTVAGIVDNVVSSQMKSVRYMIRMKVDRLPKRAEPENREVAQNENVNS